jgi:hypothetical protein
MWRTVYRKAAEVAEQRAVDLLKEHVYRYPHGAGGGGGNWALIEEKTIAAVALALFDAIPGTYRDLRLVIDGRSAAPEDALTPVNVQFNFYSGHNPNTLYRSTGHTGTSTSPGGGTTHGVGGLNSQPGNTYLYGALGYLPGGLATEAAATGVIDATVYHYTLTDRYTRYFALNTLTGDAAYGAQTTHFSGEWRQTAAVTRMHVSPSGFGFAVGTRLRLYGWTDG